ncbi:MAG: amino acid permease [Pseudomonadota bacterium]
MSTTGLKRTLNLTQLTLYGLGTTVGAGIYALIGEIAASAGYLAPWSFLLAASLALLTAISFATLSGRHPRAAGMALFIQLGFGSRHIALAAGSLAILAGMVSSAALLNGFVGYAQEFVQIERGLLISAACLALGLIACWGIAESVWVASVVTLIEVSGLLWITVLCLQGTTLETALHQTPEFVPTQGADWGLIITGSVLAFYAYIGFEDMIEIAEEVKNPAKVMPAGILLTLLISTGIYMTLVTAALLATSPEYLATSTAPLTDLFRAVSSLDPAIFNVIGLFAIINGALIQIIMATRIIYGLAARGQFPAALATIAPRTQTPITATVLVTGAVLVLALVGQLAELAELTAIIILLLFAGVNFSLWRLEKRQAAVVYPLSFRRWVAPSARGAIGLAGGLVCLALVIHASLY